jgi:hypothetical protein
MDDLLSHGIFIRGRRRVRGASSFGGDAEFAVFGARVWAVVLFWGV